MFILIVRNNYNSEAVEVSEDLASYLQSQGIRYHITASEDLPRSPGMPLTKEELAGICAFETGFGSERVDMVIALGGDGTFLHAARMVGTSAVPILGINFGHLGFLTNEASLGPRRLLKAALAGNTIRRERTNLRIDMKILGYEDSSAEDLQDPNIRCRTLSYFAFNELAATRGALGRLIDISVYVTGRFFAKVRGDGVIVSSATGSTGYSLSAGGPICSPALKGLLVTPLASHSLVSRPLVTAPGDEVGLVLSRDFATLESSMFIDGELVRTDGFVREIKVQEGERPIIMLKYGERNFYDLASRTFFADPTAHTVFADRK